MIVAMKPKVPMLPDITSVVPSVQISNMIYHSEQFILVVTKQMQCFIRIVIVYVSSFDFLEFRIFGMNRFDFFSYDQAVDAANILFYFRV